jgi:transposase-like protein
MGQKSGPEKEPAGRVVKEIHHAARRQFWAEEKTRIVLDGLLGEDSTAELCRREGIVQNLYYPWSKGFWRPARSAGRRHGAGGPFGRGPRYAPGGQRAEGSGRRAHARKPPAQKKHERGWGGRRMGYPASEKLVIIRLVEQSLLPMCRILAKLGGPRSTLYRWYDRNAAAARRH